MNTQTSYQVWLEHEYCSKHLEKVIMDDVRSNKDFDEMCFKAAFALESWCNEPSAYESKDVRKQALQEAWIIDDEPMWHKLVDRIIASVVREQYTTLTNLVMMHTGISKLEKREAIMLSAEVIAIVCISSELFSISKPRKQYMIESCIEPSKEVLDKIAQTCYLPPLVAEPKLIKSNFDTVYYTYQGESQILGHNANYHTECISLDVINKQNSVPLQLCQDFIDVYEEEEPEFEIESKEDLLMAKLQWERYQIQCAYFSNLLVNMGNKIYLGNKVDKRGRLYSSGYHISPQGNSYRKAVVEFYEEVIVECPPEYSY